jgi:hypothetical protein
MIDLSVLIRSVDNVVAKFDKPGHPFRGNQWTGGGGGNDGGESSSADERNKRADELRQKREKLEAEEEERVNDLKREAKKLVDSEAKVSTKSRGEYVGEVVEVGSKKLTIDVPRDDDDSREIELNWSQITGIEGVSDE